MLIAASVTKTVAPVGVPVNVSIVAVVILRNTVQPPMCKLPPTPTPPVTTRDPDVVLVLDTLDKIETAPSLPAI